MKLFVANRGEIALRVLRTAKDMGMSTAVGYCEADRNALFTEFADEAYALGGAGASAYMDSAAIIAAAQRAGADAIHPGYGFLSEQADFARAVQESSLVWIGPSPQALESLGDKLTARTLAQEVSVTPVPGLSSGSLTRVDVQNFIERYEYPVIVKKTDGGGGHGIQVLRSDADLERFFVAQADGGNSGSSASSDCGSCSGGNGNNAQVYGFILEKYIEHARHVETQCARDSLGHFAVISTRDCSVQRRNQKLIEEAPAPSIPPEIYERMETWSRALFETVDYQGLGTCEFLYTGREVYFLEVNPRLQVEHTVSEEVTGIDLVREQIRIARGEALSPVPPVHGHSIELRITSEDPLNNMQPTAGEIEELRWPAGHGIRIESGIESGGAVTANFDSMLAKIIVTAPDRATAIARCQRALDEFQLRGVSTPAPLYRDILASKDFINGDISTRWLENNFLPEWCASYGISEQAATTLPSPNTCSENRTFVIEIDGKRATLTLPEAMLRDTIPSAKTPTSGSECVGAQPLRGVRKTMAAQCEANASNAVTSPIQALVINVCAEPGVQVNEGDLLVVLESMKMENYVSAPRAGVVKKMNVCKGDTVNPGDVLVELEPESDSDEAQKAATS